MNIQELKDKYPGWDIAPPHFMKAREWSGGGEAGYSAHWRQWATPKNSGSRYTVTAFAAPEGGEEGCLKDMDIRLSVKAVAYAAEM